MASKRNMLETILAEQPRSVVVEAGYYLVHILTGTLPNFGSLTDLRPDVSDVLAKAISAIEETERSSITSLSPTRVRKYIDLLSNIVQDKSLKELQIDRTRGPGLLEDLRQDQLSA